MRETARRLSVLARRRTAELGLSGFTVEELCEEVGISRRTFFNYFASKEDAVFGLDVRQEGEASEAWFLQDRGPGTPPDFGSLLDDLATLAVQRFDRLDITADDVTTLLAVFDREPRLLTRMLQLSGEQEKVDIALVERREDLAAGDLRASTAVQIVAALSRAAVGDFFDPRNTDDLDTLVRRRLSAARELVTALPSLSTSPR